MKIKKFIFDLKTGVFKNALCLLMFICGVLVHAQDPPQYGTPFKNVPDSRDINMYQINIRAFSAKGDFKGVTAKLDNIKDLGINVIYLMPIYPVGTDNRSLNSPYCIKDFKAIGAEFGSLRDFRELVDAAHERGIAVMLDFVVNQTSWDHPWVTEHPDWFMQNGNGVIQPPSAAYKDVAGLDLSNQDMRAAMIDALRYWVFAANIDGYRMDFANNPPLEFWEQVNTNLKGITSHDLLLLAEGNRPEHFDVGFDLNFGLKWFYGALKKINNEGLSVSEIQSVNDSEYQFANKKQQVVRYTENHDSNTAEGTAIEIFGGTDAVFANFVVSAYMKGVPYLYSGQEVGSTTVIPFPWSAVNINWNQNPQITSEFKKILDFRLSSTAVRRGSLFDFSNDDVAAFTKISGDEEVLVLTNLRSKKATISLPDAVANATWKNAYTGNAATVGSTVSLKAFEYRVYVKDTADSDTYFIKNRLLGSYLYDDGDQAKYGDVTDSRGRWELEIVEGFMLFKNVATGDYLNIEGKLDFVESTSIDTSFWSTQWTVEDYDGYKRLKNRWISNQYINTENQLGYAQSTAGLLIDSFSTHWTLEVVDEPLSYEDFSGQNALMKQIRVYPVPVKDELNISIPQGLSSTSVIMYDIRGRKLLEKNFESNGVQATNVDGLTEGLYILMIYNGRNKISRKIIKE